MTIELPIIAVIGGRGKEGSGLSARWVRAGYKVIIGSRSADKAAEFASSIGAEGTDNHTAASKCDIAVLTVPYSVQKETLFGIKDALQGKILVDVTVPLVPPKVMRVQLPQEGSAAKAAQAVLGQTVDVVSAFQNISSSHLLNPNHEINCDVLVTGDNPKARQAVVSLARAAKINAIEAGPLDNAIAAEALTSLLIWINRRYESAGAGIRITSIPEGNRSK